MTGAEIHGSHHQEVVAPVPRDPDVVPVTFPTRDTDSLDYGQMFDVEDQQRITEKQAAIEASREAVAKALQGPEPANDSARNFVETRLLDVARLGVYAPELYHGARDVMMSVVKEAYTDGRLRIPRDPSYPEANADETVTRFVNGALDERMTAINTGADRSLFFEQLEAINRHVAEHAVDQATIDKLRTTLATHVARGYELDYFLSSRLSPEDLQKAKDILRVRVIEADALPQSEQGPDSDAQPSTSERFIRIITDGRLVGSRASHWLREHLLRKQPPQSAEVAVVETQDAR